MTSSTPFPRRLLLAWIGVTILHLGYLGIFLSPLNRVYMFLGWGEILAVWGWIGFWSLIVAAALHVLAKWTHGRSDLLLAPWFYFWLVLSVFQLFPEGRKRLNVYFPWVNGHIYYLGIWTLGFVLTLGGYFSPKMRGFAKRGWSSLLFFWALPVFMLIYFLGMSRWDAAPESVTTLGHNPTGKGAPVVVIIADKIGYKELFTPDGKLYKDVPEWNGLLQEFSVYHNARSAGSCTAFSLPGFLLQEKVGHPIPRGGQVYWASEETTGRVGLPRSFTNSLMPAKHPPESRSIIIGYYFPWDRVMPGIWQGVWTQNSFRFRIPGSKLPLWGRMFLKQGLYYYRYASKGPIGAGLKVLGCMRHLRDTSYRILVPAMLNTCKQYVQNSLSDGDFVVMHVPIPHEPFVFDAEGRAVPYPFERDAGSFIRYFEADGTPISLRRLPGISPYAPVFDRNGNEGSLESDVARIGYMGQLRYAGQQIDDLLYEIKKAGYWDRSWIFVMTDHGINYIPEDGNEAALRHVPLFVKAPHQQQRMDSWDRVEMLQMREYFPDIFEAGVSERLRQQSVSPERQ